MTTKREYPMNREYYRRAIAYIIIMLIPIFYCMSCRSKIYEEGSLKEGTRLVFQVMVNEAIDFETSYQIELLRNNFNERNIEFERIFEGELGQFTTDSINPEQEIEIRELLDNKCPDWNYIFAQKTVAFTLKPEAAEHIKNVSADQTFAALRSRLEELGLKKVIIKKHEEKADQIIIELPPIEYIDRIISIIKTTAHLEIKEVRGEPAQTKEALLLEYNGEVPDGCEILREDPKITEGYYYLVNLVPVITGRDIKESQKDVDSFNNPAVSFILTAEGAEKFSRFTKENIGKSLAIVFDGNVYSAPTIHETISERGMITGNFTEQQAEDLALVLRAGALPVSIKLIEQIAISSS
jgi:preprotein translocase subunit SecD